MHEGGGRERLPGGEGEAAPREGSGGDHLAFADARYGIPLPVTLPFVGAPSLQLLYASGAAWTGDDSPRWTQNAGVGLLFTLVSASLYVDPSDPKPRFVFTAAVPRVF